VIYDVILRISNSNAARQGEKEERDRERGKGSFAITCIVRILLLNNENFDFFYNFRIVHSFLSVIIFSFVYIHNSENLSFKKLKQN